MTQIPSEILIPQASAQEATSSGLHPLVAQRRTRRAFASTLVEPDVLRDLLEAARWAPSSMNEQPWRFILAARQNPAEFDRLLGCLMEFNARWAHHASVLLLVAAKLTFTASGELNRHAFYDVGQAMAGLTFQAGACGLSVCQMAGFDIQKTRRVFSIPEDYEPIVVAAIGYPGDPAILPEKTRRKEMALRNRNFCEQFVFERDWARPARLAEQDKAPQRG